MRCHKHVGSHPQDSDFGKTVQPWDLVVFNFQTRPHCEMKPCPLWIRNTWMFDEIKPSHTICEKELEEKNHKNTIHLLDALDAFAIPKQTSNPPMTMHALDVIPGA